MEKAVARLSKVTPAAVTTQMTALVSAVGEADSPDEVIAIEAQIDAIEALVKKAGATNSILHLRPVLDARMRARWKLGTLLAAIPRAAGPGRGKKTSPGVISFKVVLAKLGLTAQLANKAQKLGAMPEEELDKALASAATRENYLVTFEDLITLARPFWYKARRKQRHREIADAASATIHDNALWVGPFTLLYADPPWEFETHSWKGEERSASRHYDTMSLDQIIDWEIVAGQKLRDSVNDDAALFLWCTSSNIDQALEVMAGWGFEFKSSAVWVKDKIGTGYIFRNKHEVLLYGTCGDMPAPQFQPASVFEYPRGKHSAKPPEIRKVIEKMYPDFAQSVRVELFARGEVPGWSTFGYEA